jgi:hypothetical protein
VISVAARSHPSGQAVSQASVMERWVLLGIYWLEATSWLAPFAVRRLARRCRLKGGFVADSYAQRSSRAGSRGSVAAVERNPALRIKSNRPNHLGPRTECSQISAAPLARITRVFEQGKRFERSTGTERPSTKLSQELNEAFVWIRFESADVLPRSLVSAMNRSCSSVDILWNRLRYLRLNRRAK